ncbi:interleukin-17B isoform X2 [Lepisosteus oculatus]|nr:PREDICTED: interleukin-17B isoform X2 [Lepisosteus oculatus]XP_015204825.1 PREDICTED: interleukin-17B isoform X2 [Lepisosteus oculatus]XP_015204826.1 PREDICTED: interleukin-17B isoform X2 [Lepisosteus oculatus]
MATDTESRDRRKDERGARRKNGRLRNKGSSARRHNGTSMNSSPDPVLVTAEGESSQTWEEDYEKSIGDMVAQVRNNSALSKTKCAVDRRLWMSNTRSLSPWSYSINHDENRIPVDIPEAQCSCSGCINPFTMQEDRTMTSVPIYTKIPVKRLLCDTKSRKQRKKKKNCIPEYRTVVENIAVGCTCIL